MRKLLKGREILHARIVCSSYLHSWRQIKKKKELMNYSYYAKQGGGVLLDVSHEFDYVRYLFGDIIDIYGRYGRMHTITIDAEDFADVLLQTKRKVLVNLHLNFNSLYEERRIIVNFTDGYIIGDLIANTTTVCRKKKVINRKYNDSRDMVLLKQMRYFFNNIGNKHIMNDINESSKTLGTILEFKKWKGKKYL
ncbi:MAG: hypothetical protein GF384_08925 [Elusimicrobia bacterium]|nr:hypothetical protein [Elusimicrobiota bacterium]